MPRPVTPADRLLDPEHRLQQARELGWRFLNRRDRTEAEVCAHLADRRVEPALIDAVLAELREGGYLDDARYAQRFAEDQRRLQDWGPERIERRLRELGVAPEHVAAAVGERTHDEELDAAVALLARRFPTVPETPRDLERALGVLVRKGHGLELAHDALRRFARVSLD